MKIKINTRPFGEIEVDEDDIIDFPEGILGFDHIVKFIVLDETDKTSPFKWLQAYDEPDLAFVIIDPLAFMSSYEVKLSQMDLDLLQVDENNEIDVFAIVTIPDDPKNMTGNLQGPIVINFKKRKGKQAISLNDKYHVRHKILDEMKKKDREKG